jgi:Response regulators consisting of a CheY-like receiver domain and a winged-helix DNA-binding domain
MRRLLAIDDDRRIRRLLEVALGTLGWDVSSSVSGAEGLDAVRGFRPDLVLLDLNLPDLSGLELLESLRRWSSVPVIVLSVRDSERDIVDLLNSGADDYVTKPFHTNELVARIEAVLRRRLPTGEPLFRSGRLEVDAMLRLVRSGGEAVRLTPTEYAVLDELVRHAGRIVTREMLLKEVWGPGGEAEEGSLRVFIRSLRQKLEADPSHPELIVTEPGVGYRLATLPFEGTSSD